MNATGTAHCPICGYDQPHNHTAEELAERPYIDGDVCEKAGCFADAIPGSRLCRLCSKLQGEIYDTTGNCYAACISTITGIPFDSLKLTPEELEALDSTSLQTLMNRRMAEHGWWRVPMFQKVPVGIAIAGGKSPRGDYEHAVIVKDGRPYFDPHPSGAFVESIDNYEVLIPFRTAPSEAQ